LAEHGRHARGLLLRGRAPTLAPLRDGDQAPRLPRGAPPLALRELLAAFLRQLPRLLGEDPAQLGSGDGERPLQLRGPFLVLAVEQLGELRALSLESRVVWTGLAQHLRILLPGVPVIRRGAR